MYTVRLVFARLEGDEVGQRVFDVSIQGRIVAENLDVAAEAERDSSFVVRKANDGLVTDDLVIEVREKIENPTQAKMAILSGIEVERSTSPR